MNNKQFQETLNRLREQADTYRANLNRYQTGLAELRSNIQQFDVDLAMAKQRFASLSANPDGHVPVMKLYAYNEQVA